MKKVLKISKYIVFLFVLMFGINVEVNAEIKLDLECIYEVGSAGSSDNYKLKLSIFDDATVNSGLLARKGQTLAGIGIKVENWEGNVDSNYLNTKSCPKYALYVDKWQDAVYFSWAEATLKNITTSNGFNNYAILKLTETKQPYNKEETEEEEEENNPNASINTDSSEGCEALGDLRKDLKLVWFMIQIAAPILVIVFGSLDFFQAVIASDEKQMKTATTKFSKRLILAAAIFFLPYIINVLFAITGLNDTITDAVCGIDEVETLN